MVLQTISHCQVLQLQHATQKRYLTVTTGQTSWGIRASLNSTSAYLQSSSAGSSCPASPAAAVSGWTGRNSWQFANATGDWIEAGHDIVVTCETPNRCL